MGRSLKWSRPPPSSVAALRPRYARFACLASTSYPQSLAWLFHFQTRRPYSHSGDRESEACSERRSFFSLRVRLLVRLSCPTVLSSSLSSDPSPRSRPVSLTHLLTHSLRYHLSLPPFVVRAAESQALTGLTSTAFNEMAQWRGVTPSLEQRQQEFFQQRLGAGSNPSSPLRVGISPSDQWSLPNIYVDASAAEDFATLSPTPRTSKATASRKRGAAAPLMGQRSWRQAAAACEPRGHEGSIVVPKPIKGSPETARHLTDEGLLRPPIGAPPAVQLLTRRISFSSSPSCASGRISPGCLLTPNAASEPKMPARVDTPGLSKHKRSASPFITIKPPPASLDTLRNINLMVNRVQQASTRGRVRSNGRTAAAAKAAAAKADKDAKEGKEGKAQKSEHGRGGEAEVPPGKAEEAAEEAHEVTEKAAEAEKPSEKAEKAAEKVAEKASKASKSPKAKTHKADASPAPPPPQAPGSSKPEGAATTVAATTAAVVAVKADAACPTASAAATTGGAAAASGAARADNPSSVAGAGASGGPVTAEPASASGSAAASVGGAASGRSSAVLPGSVVARPASATGLLRAQSRLGGDRPPSVTPPPTGTGASLTQLFAPKDRASPAAGGRASALGGRGAVVGCFGGLGGALTAAPSPSPTPLSAPSPTPPGAAEEADASSKKFVRSGAVSPAPPNLVNTGGRGGRGGLRSNINFTVRAATPTKAVE